MKTPFAFLSSASKGLAVLTFLLAGPACRAEAGQPKQAEFYAPETVQTIHLEIAPENLRKLKDALPERIYVPGTFRWNDRVISNVGIRYKGNSSSQPQSPHKRSFLIKFGEFTKAQRFLGLRRVALDNGIQFGSLFSERLITDILRDLGVNASRCNHAKVYLNGEYLGVHVNVERLDETFLEQNFGAATGPLFKVHEGGPGADLRPAGDPKDYEKTFELETKAGADAFAQLAEFIRTLNPEPPGTAVELERVLDLDAFIKTTAVLLLSGAFDQLTGWGPHNYYLYRNPADQRWTYLPWDLDVGFADQAFGRIPVLDGWHAAWPTPVSGRPLLEHIVTQPELLARYRRDAGVILEKYFRPEILIPKLHALYAPIEGDLQKDPFPKGRVTVPSDTSYRDVIASMESFIRKRYDLARAQLEQPGERPTPKQPAGNGGGAPVPGADSPDAPSDLRVVRASAAGVELQWVDNAVGERFFIVQRAPAEPGTEFQNLIGLPGENIVRATDTKPGAGTAWRYRVYALKPTPQGPQGTGVSNVVTVTVPND